MGPWPACGDEWYPLLPDTASIWQARLMRIQSLNHSTYQHQYHIVWGTKYRRKYIKDYVKEELLASFADTCSKYPTLQIINVNTDNDHIHMQIEIPPDIPVCEAVQKLKQNSSIRLRRKFKFIKNMYLENGIWGVGYFSSTIGLNEEQIKKYIEKQSQDDYPTTIVL